MSDEENGSIDGDIFNTQDKTEVVINIKEKFGNLAKEDFKSGLTEQFKEDELHIYRQALYDFAIKNVPNTPFATLVERKAMTGGSSVKTKLAEDIFTLFHYIEGDCTIDLFKLFPERERARIKRLATASLPVHHRVSRDASTSIPTDLTCDQGEIDNTMVAFCRELLAEMRKSREDLCEDIRIIRGDTALIHTLRTEIGELKFTVGNLTERVVKLEKETYSKNKQVEKLTEKHRQLEFDVDNMRSQQTERLSSLREALSNITQRLNAMDASNWRPKHTNGTMETSNGPDMVKSAFPPMRDKLSDQPSDSITPESNGAERDSNKVEETAPLQTKDVPVRQLRGFIPREQRPILGGIYVAGILAEKTDTNTLESIRLHLEYNKLKTRSVRIIKHKGNTVAVKLVVQREDIQDILRSDSWPSGILVREWINQEDG